MKRAAMSVVLGLVLATVGQSARAAIVWVDPNDYTVRSEITPSFVTLTAIQGNTAQNPPDGRVLALTDDKEHYDPSLHFFGWHIRPPVDADQVAWLGKWANLQAEFDQSVSYVSVDFYRNDFSTTTAPDEIGFIMAYDSGNNLIWNEMVPLGDKNQTTVEISLNSPEIKKVIVGGAYIKNLTDQDVLIQRLGYALEPIPEPTSTVALLSGGAIGLVGLALRRRKSK